MFQRMQYTWQLMGASWTVLKRDKELILFPLFSGIACMLVIASFVTPLFFTDMTWLKNSIENPTPAEKVFHWAYLFAFYFVWSKQARDQIDTWPFLFGVSATSLVVVSLSFEEQNGKQDQRSPEC